MPCRHWLKKDALTMPERPVSESFPHIRTPWKAIAAEYCDAIAKGDLAPGEPLGSADDIAAMYFVNRKTVRKALVALAAEGLIEKRPGRGYFMPGESAPSVSALNVERQRAASAGKVRGTDAQR